VTNNYINCQQHTARDDTYIWFSTPFVWSGGVSKKEIAVSASGMLLPTGNQPVEVVIRQQCDSRGDL
jgi:hypothetical protein